MEKVTITLTLEEATTLYALVRESSDTHDEDWNKLLKKVEEKLRRKI